MIVQEIIHAGKMLHIKTKTNSKNKNSNHIKTVQKTFDFSFAFLIKNYKFLDQVFKYYFTI